MTEDRQDHVNGASATAKLRAIAYLIDTHALSDVQAERLVRIVGNDPVRLNAAAVRLKDGAATEKTDTDS
jgi:hypothetical protein